ncbi:DUF58 domain-containing protein [Aquifex aeolicus]|uniref:Uncharacterized protein n=1 Tax=Aquifex aeolicus (strain VF5) TaxID=224324 RepID=O67477_AQUAE|nr:DUF58 domain-containing protein [Aquifex aeolicus]AAC07440.1 hypothetical protein aq_1508 [Aquifex aeolicus VF5]
MKVRVNRAGQLLILLTIFLGVAAANTANNGLYIVVSFLLAGMLISGVISLYNLKNIDVRIKFPEEVFAQTPTFATVSLRKNARYTSFLIKVSNKIDEVIFPKVSREWVSEKIKFLFQKRGYYEKVKVKISSDFPFGMFRREYEKDVRIKLIVFPKPIPTTFNPKTMKEEEGEKQSSSVVKGYEEVKEIRDYVGEPMKLIHWKASARLGELKVKEMLTEEQNPIILSLDSVSGDLETKLSKLTYLVLKLSKEGYSVGVKLGNKLIEPARGQEHVRQILKELALYNLDYGVHLS